MREERTTYLILSCDLHTADRKWIVHACILWLPNQACLTLAINLYIFHVFVGKISEDGFCRKKLSYLGKHANIVWYYQSLLFKVLVLKIRLADPDQSSSLSSSPIL